MPPNNIHEPKISNRAIATYHNVVSSSFETFEKAVGTGVRLGDIDAEPEGRIDGAFEKDIDGD